MGIFTCPFCHKMFRFSSSDSEEIVICPYCEEKIALNSITDGDFPQGTKIGGYEIIKIIGKGGMGNVYLANQLAMNRLVALKVLPPSMTTNKEDVNQFLREVKMTGRLQHPNIVTAIDAGEENGIYYLVTRYVAGDNVEAILEREGKIDEIKAVKYAIHIGEALNYAWRKHKVLHKDIKPGNIIIDEEDKANLLDMGIAQRIGGDEQQKKELVEGSPYYMSPEQTRNEDLDWTTDLYSLGATLYHMCVGVPPFDHPDIRKIIEMHTTEPFPEPAKRNPNVKVSPHTVKLLKIMMAKTPSERFVSWDDFLKISNQVIRKLKLERRNTIAQSTKTTTLKKLDLKEINHKELYAKSVKEKTKRKKESVSIGLIISILLALFVVGGGVFYYISANIKKSRAAKIAILTAEDFFKNNPYRYDEIKNLFFKAKEISVGTKYQTVSKKRYKEIINYIQIRKQREKRWDAVFERVEKLIEACDYENALELLNTVDMSEDPKRSLRKKCLMNSIKRLLLEEKKKQELVEKRGKIQTFNVRERIKQMLKYKKSLEDRKPEIMLRLLKFGVRKNFHGALKYLKSLSQEYSEPPKPFLKKSLSEFKEWLSFTTNSVASASSVWDLVLNGGSLMKGIKLHPANCKEGKVEKIEKGYIYLYFSKKEKIKLSVKALKEEVLTPLLIKSAKKLKNPKKHLFNYMLWTLNFTKAKRLANTKRQQTELARYIKLYFERKRKRINELLKKGKKEKVVRILKRLRNKYGKLPEFEEYFENFK